MDDRTVAIGALAIATVSAVSGLMIGAAGGAFGNRGPDVVPPPLTSEGLQAAGPYSAEPATFQVFVPPTPTWQMAELTTPRVVTLPHRTGAGDHPAAARALDDPRPAPAATRQDHGRAASPDDQPGPGHHTRHPASRRHDDRADRAPDRGPADGGTRGADTAGGHHHHDDASGDHHPAHHHQTAGLTPLRPACARPIGPRPPRPPSRRPGH